MKRVIDMEVVFRYVTACDARRWRPVFTLEEFRAIYQAVVADPDKHPHTDSLPPHFKRVRLYGVEITVDDKARPPMPEEMMDSAPPVRDLTDLKVQAELMYGRREWDGYEAHDLPPRSM